MNSAKAKQTAARRAPGLGLMLAAACLLALVPGTRAQPVGEDRAEVFMWLGGGTLFDEEPKLVENLLHFARRHRIIPYEAGAGDPQTLRTFLRRSREAGIERTWIEIRPRREETGDATARTFAQELERRAETLARFRRLARIYRRYDPALARITIFDEAPLGAFANIKGEEAPYRRSADRLRTYGPRAFAQMKKALESELPQAEVGVFLHHPHSAPPPQAGPHSFIASFMEQAEARGATPDFIYSDLYRGYFRRGYGGERTDEYIRTLVAHTDSVAAQYGADAYHLGQAHTIKLGYTPSRREIDANVRATLEGGADGLGWYWPNYAAANRSSPDSLGRPGGYDVSFDPFVPNAWGTVGPAGSLYGTSKDRFVYSYLRVLEATGKLQPPRRFDLWLYGDDFDHVEHRLSLRTPGDSAWTFVGHFNPQQDAGGYVEGAREKYMYSYDDRRHAVAFHGLRRARFLDNGRVEVKIETPGASDGSAVRAAYAMPYRRTRNYATEGEITHFIEEQPRWVAVNSLARHVRPRPQAVRSEAPFTVTLQPGDARSANAPASPEPR